MLSLEEGKKTVKFSREVIESVLKKRDLKSLDFEDFFDEKLGVFVTIHMFPLNDLRGCIGIPKPIMSLKNSITEASKSVIRDPRFPPLSESELDKIIIEITILTKPKKINVIKPEDYINEIIIGRDGLIIEKGFYSGLLLPQVPVEQGWDVNDYLINICLKAGIPPDSWMDKETNIYKFSGQIFTEIEPEGDVREKNLNGFNN
jgi:uncharacterized protein (TIGR00296 family)